MSQSYISRIKDFLGAMLASMFLLGGFCLQTSFLSLLIENAEFAENHSSDFASVKNTEQSRSLSSQSIQLNEAENGKIEESSASNIRSKRNGERFSQRNLWDPFLPDALCLVSLNIYRQGTASESTFVIIFSDYHKQSFARAGPDNFLMA